MTVMVMIMMMTMVMVMMTMMMFMMMTMMQRSMIRKMTEVLFQLARSWGNLLHNDERRSIFLGFVLHTAISTAVRCQRPRGEEAGRTARPEDLLWGPF